MDAEKKRLRDEVAELSEAVRDLRDELAQERLARAGAHACGYGCHCVHPIWVYPHACYPQPYVLPTTITYTTGDNVSTSTIPGTVTTNATYSLPVG